MFVKIQIVNFNQTIFDTADLSTIRGASYAANKLPEYILKKIYPNITKRQIISSAASHILAKIGKIDGKKQTSNLFEKQMNDLVRERPHPKNTGALAKANDKTLLKWILPHMSLIWAVSEQPDLTSALNELSLKLARRQSQWLSTDILEPGNFNRPCTIDGWRPAAIKYYPPNAADVGGTMPMSYATATRRAFGRGARRRDYYKNYIGVSVPKNLTFTNTFEQIVQDPPQEVPERLRNKICCFAMDMTALGKRFEEAEKKLKSYKELSAEQLVFQKGLIKAIVKKALEKKPDMKFWRTEITEFDPVAKKSSEKTALRLETLMIGGDECLAVFPAWCLEDVMTALRDFVSRPNADFAFASGVIIAPSKTPISLLKRAADELTENAKIKNADGEPEPKYGLQYFITGHVDLPPGGPIKQRERLFGLDRDSQKKPFTFDLTKMPQVFDAVRKYRGIGEDDGVSHSKLTRKVQASLKPNADKSQPALFGKLPASDLKEDKSNYMQKPGAASPIYTKELSEIENFPSGETGVPLLHLAWLWSFVLPKAGTDVAAGTGGGLAIEVPEETADSEAVA